MNLKRILIIVLLLILSGLFYINYQKRFSNNVLKEELKASSLLIEKLKEIPQDEVFSYINNNNFNNLSSSNINNLKENGLISLKNEKSNILFVFKGGSNISNIEKTLKELRVKILYVKMNVEGIEIKGYKKTNLTK